MSRRYEFGQLDYSRWEKTKRFIRATWRRMHGDWAGREWTARRRSSVGPIVIAAVIAFVLLAALIRLVAYGRGPSPTTTSGVRWDAWRSQSQSLLSNDQTGALSSLRTPRVIAGLLGGATGSSRSSSSEWSQQPSRHILLVSYDISGPNLNGGIGTANTHMARLLAREHQVTMLHAGGDQVSPDSPLSFQGWVSHFRQQYGVELLALPLTNSYHYASAIYEQVRSYEVLLWLINYGHRFDIVHIHDWRGLGYYTLLSAQQGHPALQHLTFVTVCHSSTLWSAMGHASLPNSLTGLKIDFMERQSVRFSQHLVSPSAYFLQWMMQHQYIFPTTSGRGAEAESEVHVMRNPIVVSPNEPGAAALATPRDAQQPLLVVSEIVFFGRLEQRKGLDIFLDAIDALQARLQPDTATTTRFTLLGKNSPQISPQLRERVRRVAALPNWSVLTNLSAVDAIAYLLQPGAGRLAVMPSRSDNSPYTVQEALVYGIPFLAADVGGVAELIDEHDRAASTFRPTPTQLTARLETVLRDGFRPALPAFDVAADGREWLDWHAQLQPPAGRLAPDAPLPSPLVSVVMATYNRTRFVLEALLSLRDQSYRNLEVIVVDDGTEHPVCQAYLKEVAAFVRSVPSWQLLVVEHGGESIARNQGVAAAKGDYLIFMDDDNLARPEQVATFIRAMHHTRADILTCMADSFIERADEGGSGVGGSAESGYRWMPLGPAAGVSVYNNVIGDANFMIRRDVYDALGGFSDGVIAEDWELLTRALLAGAAIQLIPHSLLWKRVSSLSKQHITQAVSNQVAVSDAFLGPHMPHELGLALLMSRQALAQRAADELHLTNSAQHFGSKYGYRRWQYNSRLGDDGPLRPMEARRVAVEGGSAYAEWRLADADSWIGSDGSNLSGCVIRAKLQQPCFLDDQPVSVIRTWLVDMDAIIAVSGKIWRPQRCPAGGPLAFVQLDQQLLFQEEVQSHDSTEHFHLELAVEMGDMVHFGVLPGGLTLSACREIALEVSITLVKR